jgi:hypothetical protein
MGRQYIALAQLHLPALAALQKGTGARINKKIAEYCGRAFCYCSISA